MMGRRFQDAKEHLQQFLLKDSPEDPELWDLLGQCYEGTGEYDLAMENFKKAIAIAPSQVQVYPRLASVLRYHSGRDKEADQWMEKMVAANPKSAQAHFLRGSYLKSLEPNDEAFKEAQKSLELAPDNRDGLWLAAQCCLSKNQFAQAHDYATRSIKLYPNNVGMYTVLADIELRAGNQDKAVAAMRGRAEGHGAEPATPLGPGERADRRRQAEGGGEDDPGTGDRGVPQAIDRLLEGAERVCPGTLAGCPAGPREGPRNSAPVAEPSEAGRRVDRAVLWPNGKPRSGSGVLPPRIEHGSILHARSSGLDGRVAGERRHRRRTGGVRTTGEARQDWRRRSDPLCPHVDSP